MEENGRGWKYEAGRKEERRILPRLRSISGFIVRSPFSLPIRRISRNAVFGNAARLLPPRRNF